jgi:uncharacterized protein (DUF2062 family)
MRNQRESLIVAGLGVVVFVLGMLVSAVEAAYIGIGVIALGLGSWWFQEHRRTRKTDRT